MSTTALFQTPIQTLQVDLITACNARCPFCLRQDDRGRPQHHYPSGKHLDLELFSECLRDPALSDLKEILFCGNYGDALASPHLGRVLDIVDQNSPHVGINFHTNGGLGGEKSWLELGRRLQGHGRYLKFSIDGLEDTNHLYRRGVSWKQVMQNAETFIRAGGRAIWKFVVFDHNRHQIDQARELAEKMGFARFETKANFNPEGEELLRNPHDEAEEKDHLYLVNTNDLTAGGIRCQRQEDALLFLDFDGKVWPCCWIAGWPHSSDQGMRSFHQENIVAKWGADFNSLEHHSLSEILSHPWFARELTKSWQPQEQNDRPLTTHYACVEKCGKCQL